MKINGTTKVTGIFGYPVEHSFSPAMHNAAFIHLGMDFVYVPFPVRPDNIGAAVEGIRAMSLAGVNVTIPHKTSVMAFLDEISLEAKLIGAVNTIVNADGHLKGFNTDAPGFLKSLEIEACVNPQGKKIFILGAGGAARAVSVQLALAGAEEIIFASPVSGEAARLNEILTGVSKVRVGEATWNKEEIAKHLKNADILINSTPLGMHPKTEEMPPVDINALSEGSLVCDLVYNPAETMLLRKAREWGLPTLNGMGMLLYQGALAFELWTGVKAPVDVMREAFEKLKK